MALWRCAAPNPFEPHGRPQQLPATSSGTQSGSPARAETSTSAVYVPSCTNRIFGRSAVPLPQIAGQRNSGALVGVAEALVDVSARAGLPLWVPDDVAGS
ncbi:MAG TPA: hypothetical protein VFC52_08080, partial [Solirubrobacterales bacterium]|nr:hypothetical protein [Solirubrobacterales bacterium]